MVATVGPTRGEPIPADEQLKPGDEFPVIAVQADQAAPWPIFLLVWHPTDGALWWPGDMFETVDTTMPSNWVIQLHNDTSLHLAPKPWLQTGFWMDYAERRSEEAVQIFERELATILRES